MSDSGSYDRGARARHIASLLQEYKQRATFATVAGVVGGIARGVGRLLGERNRTNSWVVNAKTGMPTGYREGQIDPELLRRLHEPIIRTSQELREFLSKRGEGAV